MQALALYALLIRRLEAAISVASDSVACVAFVYCVRRIVCRPGAGGYVKDIPLDIIRTPLLLESIATVVLLDQDQEEARFGRHLLRSLCLRPSCCNPRAVRPSV